MTNKCRSLHNFVLQVHVKTLKALALTILPETTHPLRQSVGTFERVSFCDCTLQVGEGKEGNPGAPRVVDLVQLEKVVRTAPAGLQIAEAVKAKKTVAR